MYYQENENPIIDMHTNIHENSYADKYAWMQFLAEEELQQAELNKYISECLYFSEGTNVIAGLRSLNEAISDKISSAWDKVLDFLRRMWAKFVQNMSAAFSDQKDYLEKYKDIILSRPVKFGDSFTMFKLDQGVKNIVATPVPTIDAGKLDRIPVKEEGKEDDANYKKALDKMRTDYFIPAWGNGAGNNNPDGEDFAQWAVTFFKGAIGGEVSVNASALNMTDMYNYCHDWEKIKAILDKDITAINKTSAAFTAEIKKVQADIAQEEKDAAAAAAKAKAEEEAKKREQQQNPKPENDTGTETPAGAAAAKEVKTANGANPPSNSSTNPSGGIADRYVQKASAVFSDVYGTYITEFEVNSSGSTGSEEQNSGTTAKAVMNTNNTNARNAGFGSDADKRAAANANKGDEKLTELNKKAELFMQTGASVATAKMTAAEFINKEYYGIIKAHVAYYVGREDKHDKTAVQTGTNYNNAKAQQASAPANNNQQGGQQQAAAGGGQQQGTGNAGQQQGGGQ